MERYFLLVYSLEELYGEVHITTTRGSYLNRKEIIDALKIKDSSLFRVLNIIEFNSRKDAREWSRDGEEYSIN